MNRLSTICKQISDVLIIITFAALALVGVCGMMFYDDIHSYIGVILSLIVAGSSYEASKFFFKRFLEEKENEKK